MGLGNGRVLGLEASGLSTRLPAASELDDSVKSNIGTYLNCGVIVESGALATLDLSPESCVPA